VIEGPTRADGVLSAARAPIGATAAGFAALAEAGIIFLPLTQVVSETSLHGAGGPLAWYPAFALLFVGATALATARRASAWLVPLLLTGAVAVGVVQVLVFGSRTVVGGILSVGLSFLIGLRVMTLALRDWRDPIQASFGWGAGILLIEVVLGGPAGFAGAAWLVVPIFFVASLASRAASVRLSEGTEVVGQTSMPWFGLGAALAAVVAAVGAVAAAVGGEGGLLQRLGGTLALALYGLIYAGAFVLLLILRPAGWALHALGFHSVDAGRLARHLRRNLRGFGHALRPTGEPGFLQRLLGLAILVGIVLLLGWLIVRQRRKWALRERRLAEVVDPRPGSSPRPARSRRRDRSRRRRELPEDTVRRWYAETLIELERKGISKLPWRTPGEFLEEANEAFPGAAGSFTALTRAYEDVRYGRRAMSPERLDRLEAHRAMVLGTLREGA
jgi:Domain of unknown function (DUF4129)